MYFTGLGLKNRIITGIIFLIDKTGRLEVTMKKELIKHQNMLVDAGTGVILFAIWSVVKVNLYLALSLFPMEELNELIASYGLDKDFFLIMMGTIVAIILLWQLGIRMFIGMAAIAEGKGKQKSCAYLVMAALLLITDLHTIWQAFGLDHLMIGEEMTLNRITSLCIECVSVYVLLELIITGIRVKKQKK